MGRYLERSRRNERSSKRAVWRLWRRERRDWRRASEERSEETIHSPLFLSRPRDKTHSGARDVPWQRILVPHPRSTRGRHPRTYLAGRRNTSSSLSLLAGALSSLEPPRFSDEERRKKFNIYLYFYYK